MRTGKLRCHSLETVIHFDSSTLKVLNNIGVVYGLYKTDLPSRLDDYTCLSVEQTNNLRTRMLEHCKNPAIIGVTHFFAEVIAAEEQRKQREKELICEFNPTGDKTSGAGHNGPAGAPLVSNSLAIASVICLPQTTIFPN